VGHLGRVGREARWVEVAFLLSMLWRMKSINLEGASGERGPMWLWPAGPDGLWVEKRRWVGW
jgi:hypothetical protein